VTLRLGIAPSRSFPGNWQDILQFCLEAGFVGVELKYELPFILPERFSPGMMREFARARMEHGLVYSLHGPYVNIGSPLSYRWRAAVDEHLRALEVAQELGAETYTVHPGFMEAKYATPELLARGRRLTAKALQEMLRNAGEITLCLENQNPAEGDKAKCAASPCELREILVAVGELIRVTWDVGHANISPAGVMGFVDELGLERIAVVHLHDNDGRKDSHDPPGTGTVPWKNVLDLLSRRENNPVLYLELRNKQDFLRGRDFLHGLMGRLFSRGWAPDVDVPMGFTSQECNQFSGEKRSLHDY